MSGTSTASVLDPLALLRPRCKVTGMSAILLPFTDAGEICWQDFSRHLGRTASAGLTPAVNMDTGYVHLLDAATRTAVLARARDTLGSSPFVAGAFVADQPGAAFNLDAYRREMDQIQEHGGMPVVFPSFGLTALPDDKLLEAYRALGRDCPRYLAFELGQAFAPFGRIYELDVYAGLLQIPQCIGAKHSSLARAPEWQRLMLRDQLRPGFLVLTGNDLAIDMIMYGSDYLLGLSTFAPDLFARRDAFWASGDPRFFELNDLLQYLGFFAFRPPVPAYRHSAAQFLALRGWIDSAATPAGSPRRPDSDVEVLRDLVERLRAWEGAAA